MKKLLFLTIASLLALPMGLSAENPYILKKGDKKPTEYKKIELKNEKTFKVTYLKGGAGDVQINQTVYVWIPKPESVAAADTLAQAGDSEKAAETYLAAATEFKLFGWDPYCRFEAAKALKQAKQYDSCSKILNSMRKEEFANPNDQKYNKEAAIMLGDVYMDAGKYAAALEYAKEQSKLKDDTLAGAAYLLCGKIYRMQSKEVADEDKQKELLMKAAYAYFGAALLFKDAVTRPEALYTSWEILKELKDARAGEFAKILRTEYPDNAFTKRLQ